MRQLGAGLMGLCGWTARRVGPIVALLVIGAVIAGFGLVIFDAPDVARILRPSKDAALERERARRHALYVAHRPLAGTPDLSALDTRLKARGLKLGSPVFVRIFKEEFELEVWLKRDDRFQHFATYPICRWSGELGPKLVEGDRQAPEGFYAVDRKLLNPKSRWHRAFNLGFPNVYDASHARTGSLVMVHGGCSSAGCIAMTNEVIDEIWRIVLAALNARQKSFDVHVLPFRMTEANLSRHSASPWAPFWHELASIEALFEETLIPPAVSLCRGHYTAAPGTTDGEMVGRPLQEDCRPHLLQPLAKAATSALDGSATLSR